ncbi:MAG TPA: hypothetical protein VMR41_05470 [Patescibacteria group bacterium]|nr:hypothetical protein [Patescibacteria group bacterium]
MKKIIACFMIMLGAFLEAVAIETGAVKCFAKIKFGQIISEARGKIAGMVFSRNRGGSFIRQKVTPLNPRTDLQKAIRASLKTAAKNWAGLGDDVQAGYDAMKEQGARHNSIAERYVPSGFNLYIALCRVAQTIGVAAPTAYPGNTEPGEILTQSWVAVRPGNTLTLTFTPPIPAADAWIIYATKPLSYGRKDSRSDYRVIAVLTSTNVSPYSAEDDYTAVFGVFPSATQQIFIQIVPVNKTSLKMQKFKAGAELAKAVK